MCNFITISSKKIKNKEITFTEALKHPMKSLGKYGKFIAPAVAVATFALDVISAKLHANKRTADVDHELKTGHRQ